MAPNLKFSESQSAFFMQSANYFAVIPANVRYSQDVPDGAKLLFGEITALTTKEGHCWATNEYFAQLYGKSADTISRWVMCLVKAGFIDVVVDQAAGNTRRITLTVAVPPTGKNADTPIGKNAGSYRQKSGNPIGKNAEQNNTLNNTSNNTPLTPQGGQVDEVENSSSSKPVSEGLADSSAGPRRRRAAADYTATPQYAERLAAAYARFSDAAAIATQWERWLRYKREQHGFRYKAADTEFTALFNLWKLAGNGKMPRVIEILNHTIGNGYKGLVDPSPAAGQHQPGGRMSHTATSTTPPVYTSPEPYPAELLRK